MTIKVYQATIRYYDSYFGWMEGVYEYLYESQLVNHIGRLNDQGLKATVTKRICLKYDAKYESEYEF